MVAVDADSGQELWRLMGYWSPRALAEGIFFASNAYDAKTYAFGKGQSTTDVSVSSSNIVAGNSVYVLGSVTDMTPGQEGNPCLSPSSLSLYYEWLYMQQPKPMGMTGVQVDIYAQAASTGSVTQIGSVMSDGEGNFNFKWTPSDADLYTITASFGGDVDYYSSYNLTTVVVNPASAVSTPAPESTSSPAVTQQTIADAIAAWAVPIIVVLVVAIIVVAALGVMALRKRP
jgi:hypothetical protein